MRAIRYEPTAFEREVAVNEHTDEHEPDLDDDLEEDEDLDDVEEEAPRTLGAWIWEVVKTWGPAILAILIIRTFIFQPFSIPSTSMVPTLLIGDHVIVTKFSYGLWFPNPLNYDRYELVDWADPARGDVIVFRYPLDKGTHYIKRVVGVPGDTIEVIDNQIVIDGKTQERTPTGSYTYSDESAGRCVERTANLWREDLGRMQHAKLTDDRPTGLANMRPIKVPEGKVFVMGDNRDHSGDSRSQAWTFVDEDLIMGKAHFIWISFNSCDGSLTPDLRFDRMGLSLYGEVAPNAP